jgi:hypothetical protein
MGWWCKETRPLWAPLSLGIGFSPWPWLGLWSLDFAKTMALWCMVNTYVCLVLEMRAQAFGHLVDIWCELGRLWCLEKLWRKTLRDIVDKDTSNCMDCFCS